MFNFESVLLIVMFNAIEDMIYTIDIVCEKSWKCTPLIVIYKKHLPMQILLQNFACFVVSSSQTSGGAVAAM